MEVLRAETNDFVHFKSNDVPPANVSSRSSTIDEDEDEDDDRLSNVTHNDDEKQSQSPSNVEEISSPSANHLDYTRQRERLAKELKDYEDRWLAHRNFLLYTQAFAMKPEDLSQQQILARLSKEERERILANAFYNPSANTTTNNPFPFSSYPWPNGATITAPPAPAPAPATTNGTASSSTNDLSQQPKSPSSDDSGNQSNSGSTTEWTFEEQFRQLYELSDEAKRKEFLDELFAFMQKRGTPVNRIPIMAKHVLDLYELFRLVVSKGGLVEVINKKLWREVTKGLNLPSSITSAAFTLRTQYMKYLYPYECEKLQLSSPSELQAAIEGNRREGRRPSYAFDYSSPPQIMPPPPPPTGPSSSSAFLSSPLTHRSLDPNHGHDAMQHAAMAAALSHPFFLAAAAASSPSAAAAAAIRIPSFDDHHPSTHLQSPNSNSLLSANRSSHKRSLSPPFLSKSSVIDETNLHMTGKKFLHPPPSSTMINNNSSTFNAARSSCFTPVNTVNNNPPSLLSPVNKLKIISKENPSDSSVTTDGKSVQITIELNGVAYQGTLYATTSSQNNNNNKD